MPRMFQEYLMNGEINLINEKLNLYIEVEFS